MKWWRRMTVKLRASSSIFVPTLFDVIDGTVFTHHWVAGNLRTSGDRLLRCSFVVVVAVPYCYRCCTLRLPLPPVRLCIGWCLDGRAVTGRRINVNIDATPRTWRPCLYGGIP